MARPKTLASRPTRELRDEKISNSSGGETEGSSSSTQISRATRMCFLE